MDTWLVWVAVFSVGVLAGPLPQIVDVPHEALDQQQAEVEGQFLNENTPNTAGSGFSRNIPGLRSQSSGFQGFFGPQNAPLGFSQNQNIGTGGFFPGHSGGGSVEVVNVVHPSLTDGFGSLEELGIIPQDFAAQDSNSFSGHGIESGLGFSSAEFGVGTLNHGNNAFSTPAFNAQGFRNQNFGNTGFLPPVIPNPNFNEQGLQSRTSGFSGQNFGSQSNTFANRFGSSGFGNDFNGVPFSPRPPVAASFPNVGHGTGQSTSGSFPSGFVNGPGSFHSGGFVNGPGSIQSGFVNRPGSFQSGGFVNRPGSFQSGGFGNGPVSFPSVGFANGPGSFPSGGFGNIPGSFQPGGFDNGRFTQNQPSQQTRVILHSVPVVVSIVNDTHANVAPHNQIQQQGFGGNPFTGGVSQSGGNNVLETEGIRQSGGNTFGSNNNAFGSSFGTNGHSASSTSQNSQTSSHTSSVGEQFQGIRTQAPGTDGFGLHAGRNVHGANSFNQNDGSKFASGIGLNERKGKSSTSIQTGSLPTAEALISTSNAETSPQLTNRAGFAAVKGINNPNLIPTKLVTKTIPSADASSISTSNTAASIASTSSSATSSNAASETQTNNLNFFLARSPSTDRTIAGGSVVSLEQTTSQLGQISHTQNLDQNSRQNILPIPEALASFAAIGTPPFARGTSMAKNINTHTINQGATPAETTSNQKATSAQTTSSVANSAIHEITTLRPQNIGFEIIQTTPLPSFSKKTLKTLTKASSSLNTQTNSLSPSQSPVTSSVTQLLVLPMSNTNSVTTEASSQGGLFTGGTRTSFGRIMHIGVPVSKVPNIVRAKVEPFKQTSSSQSQSIKQQFQGKDITGKLPEQIQRTTTQLGVSQVAGDIFSTQSGLPQTFGGVTESSTQFSTPQVTGSVPSSSSSASQLSGSSISTTHLGTSHISGDGTASSQFAISQISTDAGSPTQFGIPQESGIISSIPVSIFQEATPVSIPQLTTPLPPTSSILSTPRTAIGTEFPTAFISQAPIGSNLPDAISQLSQVGISALGTIGASIPVPVLFQSTQSTPFSITPSPSIAITPSPSFDISTSNQQQTGVQASSSLKLATSSGVSSINKGISGIVPVTNQETHTPQAIIVIDQSATRSNTHNKQIGVTDNIRHTQVSGPLQNSAQQAVALGSSGTENTFDGGPVSFLGSLNKRFGQAATGNTETSTIQTSVSAGAKVENKGLTSTEFPRIQSTNSGINIGQTVQPTQTASGNRGIQVTSLGTSGSEGSVTTQAPIVVSNTPNVPVSSLQIQTAGTTSLNDLQSQKFTTSSGSLNVISSTQDVQSSNGILLGQSAVVPPHSLGSGATGIASDSLLVLPSTSSSSSASTLQTSQKPSSLRGSNSFSNQQQSTFGTLGASLSLVGTLGGSLSSAGHVSTSSSLSSSSTAGQQSGASAGLQTSIEPSVSTLSFGQQAVSTGASASSLSSKQHASLGAGQQASSRVPGSSFSTGQQPVSGTSSSVQGFSASNRSGAFSSSAGQQSVSSGSQDSTFSTLQPASTNSGTSTSIRQKAKSSGLSSSSSISRQTSGSSSVSSSASSTLSTSPSAEGSSASGSLPVVGQHALINSDMSAFSTKQPIQSSISSTSNSNINQPISVKGSSGASSSNTDSEIPNIINNPNIVLAIPLSLFSQTARNSAGGTNAASSVSQGEGPARHASNIFNNFAFTTDPNEVLKLVNQRQTGVAGNTAGTNNAFGSNNNAFGSSFGTNGHSASSTSQNSQTSSHTSSVGEQFQGIGTQAQQHATAGAAGNTAAINNAFSSNSNAFGSSFGTNSNSASQNLQTSSLTSSAGQQFQGTGTQAQQHATAGTGGLQSSPGANNQQPLPVSITIKQELAIPGRQRGVSVVSPSGSLTVLPDTLASLRRAIGFGVPLPSSPVSTLGGKQGTGGSSEVPSTQKNQNRSKLGNVLKRESPHLS